jgi:predicted DNA-binding transcriptional regulator YafY
VRGTLARLERVLVMVPWLLQHPGASLDELAERFGSTAEEIAADLDILGYCGLPGYGGGDLVEVSVVGDRVTVRMADFFARPLRLSLREAVTLLLAGQALAGVPGTPESEVLTSALDKIRAAIGPGLAAPQVAVDLSAPGDELLPRLRLAIEERRVVHLEYRSAGGTEVTSRHVEPLAITGAHGAWYLHAHCRSAGGPRDFRLDRIKAATVTDERLTAAARADPPQPIYEPGPDDLEIVVDLHQPAWWVIDWAVVDQVVKRKHTRRVHLRTASLEWVARLVLSLGTDAAVVAPGALATRVRELAGQTLERYQKSSQPFS